MHIPKIGPSGGKEVQTTSSPAGGVWKRTKTVYKKTFDNAIFKKVKYTAENEISNPEEADKAEDVAFKFFEKINEDNAKP
jgi:hypothetical protein